MVFSLLKATQLRAENAELAATAEKLKAQVITPFTLIESSE